jgi:hypothetical protein
MLRPYFLLNVLLACGGLSCTSGQPGSNPVAGVITPEHFRFRTVVPDNDRRAPSGGWRAVCIDAQIKHGDSGAKTACKFEVGVPLRTEDRGEIPIEEAQFAAASMANRAARMVLAKAHPGDMMAVLCSQFKAVYAPMLMTKVPGARVGECKTEGIETVSFGITPDADPAP